MLVRVVADNFCAGLVIEDGVCVEAAPILRKLCIGKRAEWLSRMLRQMGWDARIVRERGNQGLSCSSELSVS